MAKRKRNDDPRTYQDATMDRPGYRSLPFSLRLLFPLLILSVCIAAGCTIAEKTEDAVLPATPSPADSAPRSFAGNWTDGDPGGSRLDMFSNHDFTLVSGSEGAGDYRRMRGEWAAVNDTVCSLHAFLPSPGGVGMGYYSATGVLDPDAGTLVICAYQPVEDCRSGTLMVRDSRDGS